MAGPLKIKTDDITVSNIQGLQELTVAEIKNYTANIITTEFASASGTASIEVTSAGGSLSAGFTSIGTFTDRVRSEEVGDHPAAGTTTSTTYTFGEATGVATDNKSAVPLRLDGNNKVEPSTDSEIDTEILDEVINAMITDDVNTAGQYWLAASAPAGGTWVNRGQIDDTQTDGTTVTKYLWQKTAATTVPASASNRTLVKSDGKSIKEFSDVELQSLTNRFRNRIVATNIGRYEVVTSAPGTGTWQQKGETLSDQLKTIADQAYAGNYTGSYSGTYSQGFTGSYTGYYTGSFTGNYTGYYTGTYAGNYTGAYTLFYGGSIGGYFNGTYTGYYSGAYTGYYAGSYSTNFAGAYSGTYTGNFTGAYSGTYTGYYTGATIQSTSSTQESKKLFLRIA